MPCGPGIFWDFCDKNGAPRKFYVKKCTISATSMAELRFINFLQHTDIRFRDSEGNLHIIQNSHFRGQVKINNLRVDGFCRTPQKSYIIEYNGQLSFKIFKIYLSYL